MIKIVTDSASDITLAEAKSLGIDIIPMHVSFKDKEYLDGIDISGKEFFEKLIESDELPRTSQIAPFEYETVFSKYPNDDILCITISSKLSGSFQSATLASKEFNNVTIIDSENVTVGEGILVKLAASLTKENKELKDIVNILNEKKKSIRLVALLDTLEYLKKGGRISAVTAVLGGVLHIKPVVEIKAGKVGILGKARGSKQGNNKLREMINEYNGIDFDYPFSLAYSGLSSVLLDKYIEDSKDLYPEDSNLNKYLIGSTIGTHIGPGAVALAFFAKK